MKTTESDYSYDGWAKQACTQQMTSFIEFKDVHKLIRALEVQLQRRHSDTAEDTISDYVINNLVLVCEGCEQYLSKDAIRTLALSEVFGMAKGVTFDGPSVAALASEKCPRWAGKQAAVQFGPDRFQGEPKMSKNHKVKSYHEFVFQAKPEDAFQFLTSEINSSSVERILVVSNYPILYNHLSEALLKRHTLLLNAEKSLTWLKKAAQFSRKSESPLVVVSNWPRRWNPVTISYVKMAGGMYGKPDDTSVGTLLEYDGDDITSLRLTPDGDSHLSIAFYFFGIYASSYYRAVCASQDCPPQEPVTCKVITCEKDPHIYSDVMRGLRKAASSIEQSKILSKHCDELDEWCLESQTRIHGRIYDGDVLYPTKKSFFSSPNKEWWQFWK